MILLDPSARPIIAHRGGAATAPENTLAAFARAIGDGAEAFELDVHLTSDGHVVVCHDATIDRTTDGSGAISSLALADLRRWNAAVRWSAQGFGEERIPLLAEVLDGFPQTPVIIELKTAAVARAAVNVVRSCGASGRVVLGAFRDASLVVPRAEGMPTLASRAELLRLMPTAVLGVANRLAPFRAAALSPSYFGAPIPVARFVRTLGVPVHVWTVNERARALRLWRAGVRGIVTDYPATMVEARRELR